VAERDRSKAFHPGQLAQEQVCAIAHHFIEEAGVGEIDPISPHSPLSQADLPGSEINSRLNGRLALLGRAKEKRENRHCLDSMPLVGDHDALKQPFIAVEDRVRVGWKDHLAANSAGLKQDQPDAGPRKELREVRCVLFGSRLFAGRVPRNPNSESAIKPVETGLGCVGGHRCS